MKRTSRIFIAIAGHLDKLGEYRGADEMTRAAYITASYKNEGKIDPYEALLDKFGPHKDIVKQIEQRSNRSKKGKQFKEFAKYKDWEDKTFPKLLTKPPRDPHWDKLSPQIKHFLDDIRELNRIQQPDDEVFDFQGSRADDWYNYQRGPNNTNFKGDFGGPTDIDIPMLKSIDYQVPRDTPIETEEERKNKYDPSQRKDEIIYGQKILDSTASIALSKLAIKIAHLFVKYLGNRELNKENAIDVLNKLHPDPDWDFKDERGASYTSNPALEKAFTDLVFDGGPRLQQVEQRIECVVEYLFSMNKLSKNMIYPEYWYALLREIVSYIILNPKWDCRSWTSGVRYQ